MDGFIAISIFTLPNDTNSGFVSHSNQSESTVKPCQTLLGGQGCGRTGTLTLKIAPKEHKYFGLKWMRKIEGKSNKYYPTSTDDENLQKSR